MIFIELGLYKVRPYLGRVQVNHWKITLFSLILAYLLTHISTIFFLYEIGNYLVTSFQKHIFYKHIPICLVNEETIILHMSFTPMNCPVSFRFLNPEIKKKAIEIANSLLEGGFEVEVSEVIALSNAKLWACYFYEKPKEKNIHVHLVPHPQGWALIPADGAFVYFMYPGKNEALLKARAIAKNEKLKLYIHSVAGNINDSESFVVNRPVPFKSSYSSLEETMEESAPLLVENKRDAVRKGRWVSRPEYASALGKAGY